MSQYKWVCFSCQTAVRRPAMDRNVRCFSCGQPCECLGVRIPIPPKSKPKLWKALQQQICHNRIQGYELWRHWNTRRIHALEFQLEKLRLDKRRPRRHSEVLKLETQLHHAKTLQPDASAQEWATVHRQIQRYSHSSRPLVSEHWEMPRVQAWLSGQQGNLLLVFEKDRVVCNVSAQEILALLEQEVPQPSALHEGIIVFPPHFSWALFVYPESRFSYLEAA